MLWAVSSSSVSPKIWSYLLLIYEESSDFLVYAWFPFFFPMLLGFILFHSPSISLQNIDVSQGHAGTSPLPTLRSSSSSTYSRFDLVRLWFTIEKIHLSLLRKGLRPGEMTCSLSQSHQQGLGSSSLSSTIPVFLSPHPYDCPSSLTYGIYSHCLS